jgi:hypothetical protein
MLAFYGHELSKLHGINVIIELFILENCFNLRRGYRLISNGKVGAKSLAKMPELATVTVLTLAPLGDETQTGLVKFVLHFPRWPRQAHLILKTLLQK